MRMISLLYLLRIIGNKVYYLYTLIYSFFVLWKRFPRFLVERVRAIGQPSCEGGKALAGQVDPTSEESEGEEGFVEVNFDDTVF
jgi:hypothetical protein